MILAEGDIGAHGIVHVVEGQFEPYGICRSAGEAEMALQHRKVDAFLVNRQSFLLLSGFENKALYKNRLSCQMVKRSVVRVELGVMEHWITGVLGLNHYSTTPLFQYSIAYEHCVPRRFILPGFRDL
jgi:hypothetical protein